MSVDLTESLVHDLRVRAALASQWPIVQVFGDTEAFVNRAKEVLEECLGPLPQLDLIEPWDEGDPEDRWEVRALLPGLTASLWAHVRQAVTTRCGCAPLLCVGASPGRIEAQDRGLRVAQRIQGGGLAAVSFGDAAGEESWVDDLESDSLHPDHEEVEKAFVEAIRRVGVELLLSSERGGDTVAAVRHRTSGRRGLRLVIQPECLDKLDGDALARLRVDLVTAVGGVVAHRAQRETGALAPDLGWDPRWGFTLVCWWIGAPGATPPGDGVLERGVNPSPAGLYRLMCGLEDWTEQLEVQVAPKTPADHDAVVEAVSVLAAQGQSVFGARPRWLWLRGEQGIQATFAPVWHIRLEGMTPETLVDMVERIAAHESVGGVRIVPGEPVGLEESWAVADVAWIWVESICVMRVRDGVSDRDLLIDTTRRIRTERDAEVERELSRAFTGLPGQLVVRRGGAVTRPMEDASGRQGLEVVFDASISRNWSMWAWALQGMARGCGESLLPVMTSGLAVEGPRLQVWFRRDVAG